MTSVDRRGGERKSESAKLNVARTVSSNTLAWAGKAQLRCSMRRHRGSSEERRKIRNRFSIYQIGKRVELTQRGRAVRCKKIGIRVEEELVVDPRVCD